jgi:CheY-like chemotaxis protein
MFEAKPATSSPPPLSLPATLVHDLRTPINHIIGYCELLIEQITDGTPDNLVPDLQKIRNAGKELLTLVSANFNSEPVAEGLEYVHQVPAPPETNKKLAEQGWLLVVDDNEANRDVLSRLLQRQGYHVANAENGRMALDMINQYEFDLILLDIMMPEMDGQEVLRRLKANETLHNIPVIVISAHSELDLVARCIEMGAEDYMPKPFNSTLLKARIGASLEKKRAHDREMKLFDQLQQNFKRLEELETLRDDLTRMIVHDMRTPLTSVITGMQTLDVVGDLNEDQHEMMSIAVSGGETLLGMINDLLDVEKPESGVMELELVLVSIPELVDSAFAQVASLAASHDLSIVTCIAPDLPLLTGDEDKLRRVLVNLLGNAIKFTPSGGVVFRDR